MSFLLSTKTKLSIFISGLISLVLSQISVYIEKSQEMITLIGVIILIDTFLGVIVAIRNKKLSSIKFFNFFIKVFTYCSLILFFTMLDDFSTKHSGYYSVFVKDGINFVFLFILLREGLSLIEKAGLLGVPIPKGILKNFDLFDDEGNIKSNN